MHEATLDDPFVGAVGGAGRVHGGGVPAGEPVHPEPGLCAAGAGPCGGGAAWGLLAQPPEPLPPEQLLEAPPGFDLATLCDFEAAAPG